MSANVPLGLALMASFTSQVGDYLTGSAEVVFGLPGDLNYSKNGMIYGARLYDATRSLRISDPEFAANLDEHFRQCVFYDVLLGRYSMKQLAESSDIWTTIAPGSQARAQRFLTRDATTGQVTSTIITCREAYDALNAQWTLLIDSMGTVFGRQLYPGQTAALAKAKLFADLPVAYQYLTGVSASATDICSSRH
jgi:conjugal transfer mating pair stabilization protein TraG